MKWNNSENKILKRLKMLKWVNSNLSKKSIISILSTISIVFLSSCLVDKIPQHLKETETFAKAKYYGFQSDSKQEIEDSYTAAKLNCCAAETPKNDVRALELYCRAAEFGHAPSMIEIGRIYAHETISGPGTAVPYDRALADAYFILAGESRFEYAKALRSSIEKEMTADEKTRAAQLAKDFPDIPCALTR